MASIDRTAPIAGPARTPGSRLTPSARALGPGLGLFAILFLLTGPAAEARADDSPATDGSSSQGGHKVHLAGARSDTLDYGWREILPVAIQELERSDWRIQRTDTSARRIITYWKPLNHLLARMFLGKLMARAVVDLVPLGPSRTAVTIRGALASDGDLEENPGFGTAQTTYARAAEKWLKRVRLDMSETASGSPARGRSQIGLPGVDTVRLPALAAPGEPAPAAPVNPR